jgi:hypothetical protein
VDTRNEREAVAAPAVPPEVIVIPSYDSPGDVFPGWTPLPAPVAEPVVAEPAPVTPVEVAEPEFDHTVRTFDDHFATGLVVARYTLFAMIAGLLCVGAYAVTSVAVGNMFTTGLAIGLVAVIVLLALRFRDALAVAQDRLDGAALDAPDDDDSSPGGLSAVEVAPARPVFDELTGSWDSWDGRTTPTGHV